MPLVHINFAKNWFLCVCVCVCVFYLISNEDWDCQNLLILTG